MPALSILAAMSRTSAGNERLAIWMAHQKRCVYCGEPIQLRDLEIDHILPASLENDPLKLNRLKAELRLPTWFDLNSACNFVPAHDWCNSRKSSRVFSQANARYFLEIAESKLVAIDRLISGLALQSEKEHLLGAVQTAIESGIMNFDDLIDVVSEVKNFPLSTQIEFIDGEWDGRDSLEEIEKLLDRPILFRGTTSIDGIEFVNDTGGSKVIRTCRDYRGAKAAGYYALTTLAMKMEAFVGAADAVLEAASRAQIPAISYLKSPHVGVADLNLLAAAVLPAISPDGQAMIEALGKVSLRDLALSNKIAIIDVSSTRLNVAFEGLGVVLKELLRADLDGDGAEEILVQYYTYAIGGTLGVSSIGLLRRSSSEALLEYESWPLQPASADLCICGTER